MTLRIMTVRDFNPGEICMVARPHRIDPSKLLRGDQAPPGYEVAIIELDGWARNLYLQTEHFRLFQACFTPSPNDEQYWLHTGRSLIAVVTVRAHDELVAAAQACSVGPLATVENVMTHKDHRGKHMATFVMNVLMGWLIHHAKKIELWCQPKEAQLKLYRSVGFEIDEESLHILAVEPSVVVVS